MTNSSAFARQQRGMVLITSLLLLVVVTILAVALFRSFGVGEKIAGNTREKQLALNAAESAEQYAEWWLSTGANGAGLTVTANCTSPVVASQTVGQVCLNALASPAAVPWTAGAVYTLPNLNVVDLTTFYKQPSYYINKIVPSTAAGTYYQIDAVGYGGSPNTVAVVEATIRCSVKVSPLMGVGNAPPPVTTC